MKTGILGLLTIALIVGPMAASASVVTFQETGTISGVDQSLALPASFSGAAIGQSLTVDFTVNTAASGVTNAPGNESYQSAVLSVSASLGSSKLGIGVGNTSGGTNQIGVFNNFLDDGTYLTEYQVDTQGNLGAVPANFTGVVSRFDLITAAVSSQPLAIYKNTSLSNAPLPESTTVGTAGGDQMDLVFYSFVNGVLEGTGDIFVGPGVSTTEIRTVAAPEFDSVSAAAGLMLLLGSLVVLRSRRATLSSDPIAG
jgi:CBS domain-containing protein